MMTFTKAEQTTIAPHHAALAAANAAVAIAGDVTADADAQHVALLGKIAALGGEPQPNDFETSASWQTAQAEHRFNLAKLQPDIAPLAAKVDAARAAFDAALPAVQHAQHVLAQGEGKVVVERFIVCRDAVITAAIACNHTFAKLAPGYGLDRPIGLIMMGLGHGIATVGATMNVDLSLYPAD